MHKHTVCVENKGCNPVKGEISVQQLTSSLLVPSSCFFFLFLLVKLVTSFQDDDDHSWSQLVLNPDEEQLRNNDIETRKRSEKNVRENDEKS